MIRKKLKGTKKSHTPYKETKGRHHTFIEKPSKFRKIERIENGVTYFIGGGIA
jgi:hypothetical protein